MHVFPTNTVKSSQNAIKTLFQIVQIPKEKVNIYLIGYLTKTFFTGFQFNNCKTRLFATIK